MSPIDEPSNARSRRTRIALLDATRSILETDGFEALTMAAVAERAQVTRRSVYLHFATRADLIAALFERMAEVKGLAASLERVWTAPDAATALDEWAAHLARYHLQIVPVDRAIERVWRTDTDAAEYRKRVTEAKYGNCTRLARRIAEDGRLAPQWTIDTAADMLYALSSSDVVDGLTADRGWSADDLAVRVGNLLCATFLGPG